MTPEQEVALVQNLAQSIEFARANTAQIEVIREVLCCLLRAVRDVLAPDGRAALLRDVETQLQMLSQYQANTASSSQDAISSMLGLLFLEVLRGPTKG